MKKYYVIWKGRKTGIFNSWAEVKKLIDGQKDAQYMGFPSKAEATEAFGNSYTKALTKRSLAKRKSVAKPLPADNQASGQDNPQVAHQIYTDGACSPNPGESGTGMAIYHQGKLTKLYYGYYSAYGTNNTAELNGIWAAFEYAQTLLPAKVEILSDSKYSIDCITKWARGWQAKGWKKANGEAVKNVDIIEKCFNFYQQHKSCLVLTYVKGHANIEGNELADRMAVYARLNKQQPLKEHPERDIATILAMPSG